MWKNWKCDVTWSLPPPPVTNCHTFSDPLPLGAWHTLWTAPNQDASNDVIFSSALNIYFWTWRLMSGAKTKSQTDEYDNWQVIVVDSIFNEDISIVTMGYFIASIDELEKYGEIQEQFIFVFGEEKYRNWFWFINSRGRSNTLIVTSTGVRPTVGPIVDPTVAPTVASSEHPFNYRSNRLNQYFDRINIRSTVGPIVGPIGWIV